MPFPTWRMPAKNWLTLLLCSAAMISFAGCYSAQGPYGHRGYPYGAPPPGNTPYGNPSFGNGTIVQPDGGGTSLGTPTPIEDGGVPEYNDPGNGSGTKNNGGGFGDQPFDDYKDRNGSSAKNDVFGRRETFRDNSYKREFEKPVPRAREPEMIKEPFDDGPSAKDAFETPFEEARNNKKRPNYDGVPQPIRPRSKKSHDPLEEFNNQTFEPDKPARQSSPKNDPFDKEPFNEKDPFTSGTKFQIPNRQSPRSINNRLLPASSSRLIGKKEEAEIGRFITDSVTSNPNPYAYDQKNYKWLRGIVNYDQPSGSWSIIYDDMPDKKDSFGGSMTLIDSPKLAKLRDHDIILVEGEVDRSVEADRLGKHRFRVEHLFGPLVPKKTTPKKARPTLAAPVAN